MNSSDKPAWKSKKFSMLFYAITTVAGMQLIGQPLDPTVSSAIIMAAGTYAIGQSYVDSKH